MQCTCANTWCKATFEITSEDRIFLQQLSPRIGDQTFFLPIFPMKFFSGPSFVRPQGSPFASSEKNLSSIENGASLFLASISRSATASACSCEIPGSFGLGRAASARNPSKRRIPRTGLKPCIANPATWLLCIELYCSSDATQQGCHRESRPKDLQE